MLTKFLFYNQNNKISIVSKLLDLLLFLGIFQGIFHSQESFPQSRNVYIVVEIFHNQGTFAQKISTNKKVFHNFFFPDLRGFSQTKIFTQSKTFSANKDQKCSLKGKILEPFSTKSIQKYI